MRSRRAYTKRFSFVRSVRLQPDRRRMAAASLVRLKPDTTYLYFRSTCTFENAKSSMRSGHEELGHARHGGRAVDIGNDPQLEDLGGGKVHLVILHLGRCASRAEVELLPHDRPV